MPRQITTFEFKLIGFLTLRQFIYLVVFFPAGFIAYKLFPIPIINILVGILVAVVGVALAFVPINDRPLDVWVKNMFKRLRSPTQYLYHKDNSPIYFLKSLFFVSDPHKVLSHVESQEKLAAYLAKTKGVTQTTNKKKQEVTSLLQKKKEELAGEKKPVVRKTTPTQVAIEKKEEKKQTTGTKKPFLSGVVRNHKLIPLPGILIYIKDSGAKVIRLLKTNPHGVFATFNPLPPAEYLFEFKDPKNTYFFDTIKLKIEETNPKPFEFFSKELI